MFSAVGEHGDDNGDDDSNDDSSGFDDIVLLSCVLVLLKAPQRYREEKANSVVMMITEFMIL